MASVSTTGIFGRKVVGGRGGVWLDEALRGLGTENFIAFAPDGLSSVGGYPDDDKKGGQAFQKVDRATMTTDFEAAAVGQQRSLARIRSSRLSSFTATRIS